MNFTDVQKDTIIEAARDLDSAERTNPWDKDRVVACRGTLRRALNSSPLPTDAILQTMVARATLAELRALSALTLRVAADHGNDDFNLTGEAWAPVARTFRAWADEIEARS